VLVRSAVGVVYEQIGTVVAIDPYSGCGRDDATSAPGCRSSSHWRSR